MYKIYSLQKKIFQKINEFSFSTLDHDLYVSGTCCNYVLCSLDPGESIRNNYNIIWITKNSLTHEKHIFQFCLKVTWMKLVFKLLEIVFSLKNDKMFFWIYKKNPGLWESGHNCFRNRNFKTFGTFCTFSEVFWTNR